MSFGESFMESVSRAASEMGGELQRLGVQGKAELAGGLFAGSSFFVAYGEGQRWAGVEVAAIAAPEMNQEQEMSLGR